MDNFNEVITDPALSLETVNAHVDSLDEDDYLLDQYRVIATSGSTRPGDVGLRVGRLDHLRGNRHTMARLLPCTQRFGHDALRLQHETHLRRTPRARTSLLTGRRP